MIGEKKGRNGVLMAVDVMGIGGLFVLYPTFMRNQSELLLNNSSGSVLTFRKHPANDAVHVF